MQGNKTKTGIKPPFFFPFSLLSSSTSFLIFYAIFCLFSRVFGITPLLCQRSGAAVFPSSVVKYSSPKEKENLPHYVEQIGFRNICFLLVMVGWN